MVEQTKDRDIDFLQSSGTDENPFMPSDKILDWIEEINNKTEFKTTRVPLKSMKGWYFDEHKNLRHESGKFFSIQGLRVQTNYGGVNEWSQPIIVQPEIGILGILCQKKDGILYFLMQAKIEPGNVNKAQLSPTVQATKSNYRQVHGGKLPDYLEYFIDTPHQQIIVDQLQSEQGARFHKKRNRNMIIMVDENEEIEPKDNFCWLTLKQIKDLMNHENIINMDARTVLSCTPTVSDTFIETETINYTPLQSSILESQLPHAIGLHTDYHLLSWFTSLKAKYDLEVTRINVDEITDWQISDMDISHKDGKYFQVIGCTIDIAGREVKSWSQPFVQQREEGIIAFIVKKLNGVLHLLVQGKVEAGNFDTVEMAPTVQCITGSYKNPEYQVPFLNIVTEATGTVHYDTVLSEEGGRFFHEQNRNIILEVGDEFSTDVPDHYTWMTFRQAKEFIKYNNYFNVEARNLIACISPI